MPKPAIAAADASVLTDVEGALYAVLPRDGIAVAVADGVVTLSGAVRSVRERNRAVTAAEEVPGVQVVVDAITVESLVTRPEGTDPEIAAAVLQLLEHLPSLPVDRLRCRVRGGVVVLTGTIPWHFERDTVLNLVATVPGVRDVVDHIELGADDGRHGRPADSVRRPQD